jgi:hypothetical protein
MMLEISPGLQREFQTAKPFPHIVLDNLWDSQLLNTIYEEWPSNDHPLWFRNTKGPKAKKFRMTSWAGIGPETTRFIQEALHGDEMIRALEDLSGISNIQYTPNLSPGGLHESLPEGFLKIHKDPTSIQKNEKRILNVILYLTKDWEKGDGGELELWDSGTQTRIKSVEPIFNRTLIFYTPESYHGHPNPVQRGNRRCICIFYHNGPAREGLQRSASFVDWDNSDG